MGPASLSASVDCHRAHHLLAVVPEQRAEQVVPQEPALVLSMLSMEGLWLEGLRSERATVVVPDLVWEVWRLLIRGDARYRMTCRLELVRCMFLRWNHLEVGDIFYRIEQVEVDIVELQLREDQHGGLPDTEMGELRGKLSEHHPLLRQ